jgi:hypothetical protein
MKIPKFSNWIKEHTPLGRKDVARALAERDRQLIEAATSTLQQENDMFIDTLICISVNAKKTSYVEDMCRRALKSKEVK